MQILTKQQLLQKQLSILSSSGPTLSSFYSHDCEHPLLFEPTPSARQIIQQKYKLTNIRTVLPGCNSIFHILAYVIVSQCLSQQNCAHDLLNKLRCVLYSEQFVLSNFVGFPHPELTSKNMKKLIVQFLQIASYHKKNLAFILAKYQIVPDIFTAIFRNLLQQFHVKDAKCFYRELNDLESASTILDFFDISYIIRNNMIAFENKTICIVSDPNLKEVFIGDRSNQVSTKGSDIEFDLNVNDEIESVAYKKQFALQNATPCFIQISGWEDAINPMTPKLAISNPMPTIEQYNHCNIFTNLVEQLSERKLQNSPTDQDKLNSKYSQSNKSKDQLHQFSKNVVAEDTRIFKHFLTKDQKSQTPKSAKEKESAFLKQKINKMKHSEFISGSKQDKQMSMLERKQTLSQRIIKNDDRSDNGDRVACTEIQRSKANKLQSNVLEVVIEPIKPQKKQKINIQQQFNQKHKQKITDVKKGPSFNASLKVGTKNYCKIPAFLNQKIQNRQADPVKNPPTNTLLAPNNVFNPSQSFNSRNAQQRVIFTYTSRDLSPLYASHHNTPNSTATKTTNGHVNQSHKISPNLNSSMRRKVEINNDTPKVTTRGQNHTKRPKTEISDNDNDIKNMTQRLSPHKFIFYEGSKNNTNNNQFFRYFGK